MEIHQNRIKYLLCVLLVIVPLVLLCGPTKNLMNCGLASKYDGMPSLNTKKNTLTIGLKDLLNSFNDSVGLDTIHFLWQSFHSGTTDSMEKKSISDIHNILAMTDILKNKGYCVAMLEPATYESIDALSKLPVLIWAIIIHHPDNKSSLISDTNLTLQSGVLEHYEDNIQIHLIDNITKENNTYSVVTRNKLTLQGLETDKLTSQILSIEGKTNSQYLQVVDCIIISSLPLLELRGHLNEWYASIPYRNIKPIIKEVP